MLFLKWFLSLMVLFWTVSCANSRVSCEPQASMEREIVQDINQYRQSKGLAALREDSRITAQCRTQCVNMAGDGKISHRGFSGRTFALLNSFPRAQVAENVGVNYGVANPTKQMVNTWIASPGHRINIEGNYHYTGVGVVKTEGGKYYYCQIFVGQN